MNPICEGTACECVRMFGKMKLQVRRRRCKKRQAYEWFDSARDDLDAVTEYGYVGQLVVGPRGYRPKVDG